MSLHARHVSAVWNAVNYDSERRRLVPCFADFYGTAAELVVRFCPSSPRILDLGAGTGILSAAIFERVRTGHPVLLDASSEMLQRAATRLAQWQPGVVVQPLTAPLPSGPFDAVVSALAIHHLSDDDKRSLYSRAFDVLAPGGIFINAEQVSGVSGRLQKLFEEVHLDRARELGSSNGEIEGAIERNALRPVCDGRGPARLAQARGIYGCGVLFSLVRFRCFRRLETIQ